MKLVFDTNVWIDELRDGVLAPHLAAMRARYELWMDGLVAAELLAGCRTRTERRVVETLLAPFERKGRLRAPTPPVLLDAGRALSRLREGGRTLKKPEGALIDAQIAMGCARGGALLVTNNSSDFAMLASVMPLRFRSFADFTDELARDR